MAANFINEYEIELSPGPFDVHAHPRIFDAITFDSFIPVNNGQDGKAGLQAYTNIALESGITGIIAMPNESVRLYDPNKPELTTTVPYPISNLDRLRAVESAFSHESVIPGGAFVTVDPEECFLDPERTRLNIPLLHERFSSLKDDALALKLYGALTTGGYNVGIEHIPTIVSIWNEYNQEKPTTMHLEGPDVSSVLQDINKLPNGKDIPLHIAHVSSREELEAVMRAKEAGMNVTCEVTPHHLFLDEATRQEIGGYGCMKPSLKTAEDVAFLWAHMDQIDIFASDCAPHRTSDKEAEPAAFGVNNHRLMLKLLLGAVSEGKLTLDDVYQKFCVTPRKRFNIPLDDGSRVIVSTAKSYDEYSTLPGQYGPDVFMRLQKKFNLVGNIIDVQAGVSQFSRFTRPSYTHLLRPATIALSHLDEA